MDNFYKSAGCVVSNNLLENKGVLKWCFRETPVRPQDTGWRFLSNIDTDSFLSNPKNFSICSLNTVIQIEPAVLSILTFPVGSDLILASKNGKKYFVDESGKIIQ